MSSSPSAAPVTQTLEAVLPPPTEASDSQPSRIHTQFAERVRTHLLPVLRAAITEQQNLVEATGQLVRGYRSLDHARQVEDQVAFFRAYTEYNRSVYELIEQRYADHPELTYENLFTDFASANREALRQLPLIYTETQLENRFAPLADDAPRVRLLKLFKRHHRTAAALPLNLRNSLRKLRKKTRQPIPPRTYRIPLRNLTQYYYREEWTLLLLPVLEKVYRQLAANTRRLWHFEDEVYARLHTHLVENYAENRAWLAQLPDLPQEEYAATIANLSRELDALEEEVVADVEQHLVALYEQYTYAYERVGTAELSAQHYGARRLRRKQQQVHQRFMTCTQGWSNTLYALYEDWRIDQEINLLCTTLFNEHTRLRESLHEKIEEAVVPQIDRIVGSIDEVEAALRMADEPEASPTARGTGPPMQHLLQQQREYIDFQLIRSVIPSAVAVLYRQALPATVSGVYKSIQEAVDTVADRRALVSTNDYDRPLRLNEINYISPRQIVSFESLPKLRGAIEETKETTGQRVLEIQKMITEIGQVSYFNLDSALSMYDEADEDPTEARATAEEGLLRATKSAELVKEKLRETSEAIDEALWQSIKQFTTNLIALKSNDYALEIKLRIAKAKALERTQALKQRSLDYVKHGIPYAARYTRQQYQRVAETVATYRQRMGIVAAGAGVTTEVSDFLNDTEVAIDRLPYVYQRLYGNRSLEDAVFYEERVSELEKLQRAYHSWGRGRYASTILVGEKGAGATTLINFFLKKLPPVERDRYEIIRVENTRRIYTEAELLQFISSLFPDASFQSRDEVAEYLETSDRKYIIVWEEIQHFYLRKVGGFVALKLLFELISRTHKQVFWLCACTQYAWDFLDKTTRISDYYEYIIPLEEVSHEQLREAILKRHRVSGYQIRYAGTGRDRARKKFVKMTEEQQQAYLEEVYFEDLKQLTAGNYSIAQLYWLRSTQQVLNDTITISSLQTLDFSFTQSLPLGQMLILHALLLHDGLSEAYFREMSERKTDRQSTATHLGLMQLRDDGLVAQKDDTYVINPLLYRQIVQLLRGKNFLH